MRRPIKKGRGKGAAEPVLDARVKPVLFAIEAACEIFDKESVALEERGLDALDQYLDEKKDLERKIKLATTDAIASGLSLKGDTLEAKAVEAALEKLSAATTRNAESLQGVKNALDHVNALIRRSASETVSEGMYNRLAKKVQARDKTMVGFGTTI